MATTAPLPSELAGQHVGPRLEECGDETLATLIAEADEAAFAVLFERHYQALYRYCRSIVHDDPDAQDALQTAWTGALVALRQGRRDAPVRPWLYRIVHNEAISVLRRRRHSPGPAEAAPLRAPSAEDHAIDRERFALLVADLRQLPERPRGALLMRELNGLSHEEIAAALDTSVAAAKQCVYEARRHLAEFAAGRQTPCDEICRSISDGDRRVLRGRRVVAHLRDCPGCAAFASTINERRAALHALTPWLAAPAAITVLDRVLRAGSGAGSASVAAGAAGAAGGAAGPLAAAGTAGPAVVAGGVVTKALSVSLISKAVIALAAVASLGGVSAVWHGLGRTAATRPAPTRQAPTRQAPTRFSGPAAVTGNPVATPRSPSARPAVSSSPATVGGGGATGASRSTAVHPATPASTAPKPGRRVAVGHTAGAVAPGQAKKAVKANGGGANHAPTPAREHGNGVAAGSSHRAVAGSSHGSTGSHGHRVHISGSPGAVAHGGSAHATAAPRPHGNGSPSGHSTATGKSAPPAASSPPPASATPPATTPVVTSPGKSGDAHSN